MLLVRCIYLVAINISFHFSKKGGIWHCLNYSEHFTLNNSFNPYNKPMRKILLTHFTDEEQT